MITTPLMEGELQFSFLGGSVLASKGGSLLASAEVVKANSSKWVHESRRERRAFAWQAGYSAFSVSESNLEHVSKYIDAQEEHHRKRSFQEELLALLKRHNLPYDERYMWK